MILIYSLSVNIYDLTYPFSVNIFDLTYPLSVNIYDFNLTKYIGDVNRQYNMFQVNLNIYIFTLEMCYITYSVQALM